jgi:hypothetical protein
VGDPQVLNIASQVFRHVKRCLQIRIGEGGNKLFATVTGTEVSRTLERIPHGVGQSLQTPIALFVTVSVIVLLEMVNIANDDG